MTVTVTCLECGEIFEAQRRSRKFCCDAHKLKYNRRRKRQAPAERKRERDRGYMLGHGERLNVNNLVPINLFYIWRPAPR